MNRRNFLIAASAAALFGCSASAGEAATRFVPARFSVEVRGSGPDVILIPGLTAGREVWAATAAGVPGYRYHLIQVSGFAGEPARGNARGQVVASVAAEIGRYIEAERLNRPALVGHSMGGTIAMMIATRTPERAGKVMVVDMLPQPAGLLGSSAANIGPLAQSLRNMAASAGGRQLLESLIGSFGAANAPGRRSDPDVVARAMHELASTDLSAELPRIAVPLTVVYASPDAASRARADRTYAAGYAARRGTRLVRIDNSGHMIMSDRPAAFRSALRAFLRQ